MDQFGTWILEEMVEVGNAAQPIMQSFFEKKGRDDTVS